ncbi:hypothetical protein Nepgr_022443 [Nepenthes gracilis]|uniref:Uncharacterized protein n=1 Tax=Nepenthes gracilis TaxID=150966 RepID=A0AAD3T0X7_NEPGR|nr:hypothetical protein Nepgr_022443 [Nepenthes gracilis]
MPTGILSFVFGCFVPSRVEDDDDLHLRHRGGGRSKMKSEPLKDEVKASGEAKTCTAPILVSYFPVNSRLSRL